MCLVQREVQVTKKKLYWTNYSNTLDFRIFLKYVLERAIFLLNPEVKVLAFFKIKKKGQSAAEHSGAFELSFVYL